MKIKKILKYLLILSIFLGIVLLAINIYITSSYQKYIYKNAADIPNTQVGLILGAKVKSNGDLSDILKDRTLKAIELYQQNKIDKLLVSGDHGSAEYDEVNSVKDFLLNVGIPKEDIFLDHAGFDTYDSIYRAKEIFDVNSVIVVTQEFHLPRAVYICRSLKMECYGYIADRQIYQKETYNNFRESLARVKSFYDVIFKSQPEFLGPQIPITGDSAESWD